ncbi:MAG TPA: DUF1844 domain-containing protein [Myxococcota bacterium]|nr:DUF1844 domain-containing protein [Myxococcota bacterium]
MSDQDAKTGAGFTMSGSDERAQRGIAPPIDFSTFVLSLGTTALYQLGLIGEGEGGAGRVEPNLPIARQTIDTLEMLVEKTRGNLSDDESKLLESIVYELHLKYVEASK